MLIPSIDLQGGRVVQLVQGDKLAIASDDLDGWIAKFAKFPKVQLIDLDAAMSRGNNDELVKRIAAQLPCRVGGGVRSVRRAEELIAAGARAVIAGSGLFRRSPEGDLGQMIDHDFARARPHPREAAADSGRGDTPRRRLRFRGEDAAAPDGGAGGAAARGLLRGVPLHARR